MRYAHWVKFLLSFNFNVVFCVACMGTQQRKYFYDFIRIFAQHNVHNREEGEGRRCSGNAGEGKGWQLDIPGWSRRWLRRSTVCTTVQWGIFDAELTATKHKHKQMTSLTLTSRVILERTCQVAVRLSRHFRLHLRQHLLHLSQLKRSPFLRRWENL